MSQSQTESRPLREPAEFRAALLEMLDGCRRDLAIFSGSLPRPLYHDPQVVEAISAFARSSRYARVRILIRDSDPLVQRAHRLLLLAQRLGSRIEIRKLHPTVDTPEWEFAVADLRRVLVAEDKAQWQGIYDPDAPVRARKLLDPFEQSWPLAGVDANLRRLTI